MNRKLKEFWQISISDSVASGKRVTLTEKFKKDGILKNFVVEFPAGSNSLVDLEIYLNNTKIAPKGGNSPIRLNDAVETFPLNIRFKRGDKLQTVIINADDTNAHRLNVIYNCEEE